MRILRAHLLLELIYKAPDIIGHLTLTLPSPAGRGIRYFAARQSASNFLTSSCSFCLDDFSMYIMWPAG